LSESGGLTSRPESSDGRTADELVSLVGGSTEDDLAGPDRGLEHSALYAIIFLVLVGGAMVLRGDLTWGTDWTAHTIMESVATILAFIVGALALVRYYSRKQVTFLLIGCGFLGAAVLDLNHVIGTVPAMLDARAFVDSRVQPAALYMWTWTAGRVFLSVFLFASLLTWGQEVRGDGEERGPEVSVYATAVVLTFVNLLFFDYIPLQTLGSFTGFVTRPAEFAPATFFLLAFIGFYRKGSWRRDQFEHWMLVSLLIGFLAHAAFMSFSTQRWDAMFDAAHLLKIASYMAILTGLLSSVYATFTREAAVLGALTQSNDALAREVDFRSKTEQAVKESSERLQGFLDNANDLIQRVDEQGRFLYVNKAWKRVLGYSDEDLDQMRLLEIVHPGHRESLDAELRRVLDGGEPARFNTEYVAADGRLVILSGSSQVQLAGGKGVATQSNLRDVTEQRLAERQLDESQRNLEALVENTGDSIWSVDREHRLITLNSAYALAIEAHTAKEPLAGETPDEIFSDGDDVRWYRELYARTLSGERHVAVRSDEVDGHVRHFELYANPIQSLEGVSGAVFFGKDVTPRHRAAEALQHAKEEAEAANKAKSDFLANMSHELRTPLNSVIGFTNILIKNKGDRLNDKDIGFLQRVLSNGKHLLALINEVLDLAKVEAGRMELIIEEIDLTHLCVETVQQLEGQARAKEGHIALLADVPDSVALVETDSAKLKQVIINMIGNALKFTHEGSVTVRLDTASDGFTPIAISVVDTGIGIPKDRLDAIFEAFQQAEAGTSRKYGGTGLGLAISRSICLLLGYDLIVESEIGKGSTFKIVMGQRAARPVKPEQLTDETSVEAPAENGTGGADVAPPAEARAGGDEKVVGAADSSDEPEDGDSLRGDREHDPRSEAEARESGDQAGDGAGEAEPARPSWGEFKVLVVDDEADSRLLIKHFLEECGCQVFTANDGQAGIDLARKHRPDLMMLDLIMPGMTGWEALRRIKADAELRTIPVVVVSVVANEGRGKLLGAVDLVTKPFEREDLLRVLWRNLGRRRGGRVLLVAEDGELQDQLAAVADATGLEVATSNQGDLVMVLAREGPDAVVLDLAMPDMHGVAALLELRDDRLHTGLPVLAITHEGLNHKEREIVHEMATLHADRSEAPHMLARLLDASFGLARREGLRG
jgi:PAS domain S-box-containing protein